MERGYHQLPDGAWVEAGSLETDATGTVVPVILTAPFGENPVVFAGVASANGLDAVVTRLRDVTREGFAVGMQEQEANRQEHLLEVIHYIAWEPSFGVVNGLRYEVGLTDARVTHQPYSLLYKGVFERPPLFLADMQTTAGAGPREPTLAQSHRGRARGLGVGGAVEGSRGGPCPRISRVLRGGRGRVSPRASRPRWSAFGAPRPDS